MLRILLVTALDADVSIALYDSLCSDEADFAEAGPRRSFNSTP
jgi:hypothetical protein